MGLCTDSEGFREEEEGGCTIESSFKWLLPCASCLFPGILLAAGGVFILMGKEGWVSNKNWFGGKMKGREVAEIAGYVSIGLGVILGCGMFLLFKCMKKRASHDAEGGLNDPHSGAFSQFVGQPQQPEQEYLLSSTYKRYSLASTIPTNASRKSDNGCTII